MKKLKQKQFPLTRQEALMFKYHGETFALVPLADVQKRADAAAREVANLQSFVAEICAKYGGHAFAEQLSDPELERLLNSVHLWSAAEPANAVVIDPDASAKRPQRGSRDEPWKA